MGRNLETRVRKIEQAQGIGEGWCPHQPYRLVFPDADPPPNLPPCWCGRPRLGIIVEYEKAPDNDPAA